MESIAQWYQQTLGSFLPKEIFVFLVSMIPLIELRGGIVIAKLLGIPFLRAGIVCLIGNILPIPFILLFIKKIFAFMKKHNILKGLVEWLERRAAKKSEGFKKGETIGLVLFVGIPIPGTGAWMGALIASLFDFDIKRAFFCILAGVIIALAIMGTVFYAFPSLYTQLFA